MNFTDLQFALCLSIMLATGVFTSLSLYLSFHVGENIGNWMDRRRYENNLKALRNK